MAMSVIFCQIFMLLEIKVVRPLYITKTSQIQKSVNYKTFSHWISKEWLGDYFDFVGWNKQSMLLNTKEFILMKTKHIVATKASKI